MMTSYTRKNKFIILVIIFLLGGSSGLVFMGGDSCSEGRVFESRHHIVEVYYSHFAFLVNIVTMFD